MRSRTSRWHEKNEKLLSVILSPTTKKEIHDRPLSCDEVINEGWMNRVEFDICAKASPKIFRRGQKIASDRRLILVDTKYEFGKDKNGNILLID